MKVALAAAAAALLSAAPAAARTVDYSLSEEQFAADAAALDAGSLPAMPSRGTAEVEIDGDARLDNQVRILGISCRAWKVDNPLSQMVRRALVAWDRDGTLSAAGGRPLVRVRIDRADVSMRCVAVKELEGRCITRTSIGGEATVERADALPRSEKIAIEVEQQHDVGTCAVARGTALSGRAASIALVERLKQLAGD